MKCRPSRLRRRGTSNIAWSRFQTKISSLRRRARAIQKKSQEDEESKRQESDEAVILSRHLLRKTQTATTSNTEAKTASCWRRESTVKVFAI